MYFFRIFVKNIVAEISWNIFYYLFYYIILWPTYNIKIMSNNSQNLSWRGWYIFKCHIFVYFIFLFLSAFNTIFHCGLKVGSLTVVSWEWTCRSPLSRHACNNSTPSYRTVSATVAIINIFLLPIIKQLLEIRKGLADSDKLTEKYLRSLQFPSALWSLLASFSSLP